MHGIISKLYMQDCYTEKKIVWDLLTSVQKNASLKTAVMEKWPYLYGVRTRTHSQNALGENVIWHEKHSFWLQMMIRNSPSLYTHACKYHMYQVYSPEES